MNKTLLILIAGIVIVGGLIGYTALGKSTSQEHTEGDGHTGAGHAQTTGTVPHDDTGTAPHND